MSTPPPAKRRRKITGNENHVENALEFEPERVSEAIQLLKSGQVEAIIINAGIAINCPGDQMVRYWNARTVPVHRVPEPNNWSDIDAKQCKGLPGIAGGMWHTYASSAHDFAIDSQVVDAIFTETTGTSDWEIRPNRFRFNPVNKDDGYKAAHIEGPNVLSDDSGISAILCVSAGRTFTYYKGSNNDPRCRKIFEDMGGKTSLFVQPTQAQLAPWQRTTIQTTKPGQIILFADSVAHEISRLGKNSLSLFLSPYDPAKTVSEIDFYAGLNRKQAIDKKKALATAPPLPTRLMLPGQRRQHPKEYYGLSRRDTEIFGSLFHSTGSYWPSDKPTFFLMHMMAFNAFKPKLMPFCFDSAGKYNYEVITPELVAGCTDFDQSYFEQLPFADITPEEVAILRAKYTGIHDRAWALVKYWTKDIRECSDNVCKRRGYF
mgnify:FL=1|tara:strand:+ start:4768 stop:6063 length:1296 start_codon:yes stop_codon:yes gene_type:complete